jgi:hypothetical protein
MLFNAIGLTDVQFQTVLLCSGQDIFTRICGLKREIKDTKVMGEGE